MTTGASTDGGLRRALRDSNTRLIGTFVIVPRTEMVEIAALAGFDLVVADWEHGPYGAEATGPLVIAGHNSGIFVVVRVPAARGDLVGAALDIGADGVIVPHVDSPPRASECVAAVRFPPDGDRSANPWVSAAKYAGSPTYYAAANRDVACIATIEGAAGVSSAAEIIATPGLDGIFIGPVDLSASLGVPGQVSHSKVEETIRGLITAADDRSVGVSIFAPTPAAANQWQSRGARLVIMAVDTSLALSGFRAAVDELRSLSPKG